MADTFVPFNSLFSYKECVQTTTSDGYSYTAVFINGQSLIIGTDHFTSEYFEGDYHTNYEGTSEITVEHLKIIKPCTIYHIGGQSPNTYTFEKMQYSNPMADWKAVINPPGTTNGFGVSPYQIFLVI